VILRRSGKVDMNLEALETLIKERRSIRKWKPENVPDELLRKAAELGTWAPNGGNYQGWQFIIVKNKELINEMADRLQSVIDKVASWPEARSWPEEIRRYQKNGAFFRNAPAVIGVFMTEYQSLMDRVLKTREAFDPEAREVLSSRRSAATGTQSAAAAVTTMLLVLHHLGLGACWLGAPLHAKREIEGLLGAPRNLALICLVAVGYPDESPQGDRKPIEQVLNFIY
jgi:nitroreductase